MPATTVYQARRIITMNPARPSATHVAVREGRILGTGSLDELRGWGPFELNDRFAKQVLMPGLVEGHSHLMEGMVWRFVYVGFHDRLDPDGRVWPGAASIDAVVERLRTASSSIPANQSILGWGFDPIYFGHRRCERADLDRVANERPVAVMHASFHIINVNTAALKTIDWVRTGIEHPGVPLGPDGIPTGELKGPEAMMPVLGKIGFDRSLMSGDAAALDLFSRLCVRQGVTTATDLASPQTPDVIDTLLAATSKPDYPTRIVSLLRFIGMTPQAAVERALELRARSTERLHLGRIKIVADGSIQGFSARMRWPGYYNGAPNGLWYTSPEHIEAVYEQSLKHGLLVHTHTNGDEATELALDCLERALTRVPARDHRFTLQHCQLADAAQFKRIKALGACVNLFANHHFYWGDSHFETTVGPERAMRMNACATALREGVPFSIHSDAPITPLAPIFTAWCAINRLTSSGRVLGEHERISVADALHAVTLGAAYTLKLDHEIGSIESGKSADFAVLDADPFEVAPAALKDIPIWGVVQAGRVFSPR